MTAHRRIALVAFACAAVGVLSSVLWDAARYSSGSFVADTATMVDISANRAVIFRLSMVTDMLGSYLLYIPLVVFLRGALRPPATPAWQWDAAAAAGIGYGLVGAAGAAAFGVAGRELMSAYLHAASAAEQLAIAASFRTLSVAVVGLWQLLGTALLGLWWIAVARALPSEWPWFRGTTHVLGWLMLATAVGRAAGIEFERAAPATPVFLPLAVWPAWLGVLLWRRPIQPFVAP